MEIKQIVKEMIAAGMPEQEILSNLADLGVADPKKMLDDARVLAGTGAKPGLANPRLSTPAPAQQQPASSYASQNTGGMFGQPEGQSQQQQTGGLFGKQEEQNQQQKQGLFASQDEQDSSDAQQDDNGSGLFAQKSGLDMESELSGNTEKKIDDLIALTKSLLDLNKKILESNRELLLRLSK